MMGINRKKCKNCKELFIPDPRNAKRQKYCRKPECRKASKAASQERWLAKPENQGYFSGTENVERVQLWRKAHPGYWRGKRQNGQNTLQDSLNSQPAENKDDNAEFAQDALQDDIFLTLRNMQKLGQDIITNLTHSQGGHYGQKGSHHYRTHPENTQALQLDRSPPGT